MKKHGILSKLLALLLVLAQLLCALPALADEVTEASEALAVEIGEAPEAAESGEEPADETVEVETEPAELPEVAEAGLEAEDVEADAEAPAEEQTEMIGDAADIGLPEVAEDRGDRPDIITGTISFDANGGKGTMDSIEYSYDSNADEQTPIYMPRCRFTRDGYVFAGWYTTDPNYYSFPAEELPSFFLMNYFRTHGNGDITFIADWIESEEIDSYFGGRYPYGVDNGREAVFKTTTVELFVGDKLPLEVYHCVAEPAASGTDDERAESQGYTLVSEEKLKDKTGDYVYSFTSDDPGIATIDDGGKVTGVKPGETIVRVSYTPNQDLQADGVTDTGDGYLSYTPWCFVIVKAKNPTGVQLNPTSLTLAKKGATATLKATVLPEGTTSKLTWSSSNAKVAKVDKNGKVTAVAPGTATVTVKTANGEKATCKVTVRGITQTAKTVTVKLKKTLKLQSYVKTFGFKASKLTWTSANAKIAKVNKTTGVVTGVKVGSTKVTGKCTVGGTTYKVVFTVTVKRNAEGNIKLN